MKISRIACRLLVLSTALCLWISPLAGHAAGKSCQRGLIVFAGRDARGAVAFALEQTYAQGDKWDWTQVPQSAWLYDEAEGWVRLKDRYGEAFEGNTGARRIGGDWTWGPNVGFQSRMSLHSDMNRIHLSLKADRVALQRKDAAGQLVIANGEATFTWNQRRITGRVYVRHAVTQGQGAMDIDLQNNKGMRREGMYVAVGGRGFMSVMRSNERSMTPMAGEQAVSLELDSTLGMSSDLHLEALRYSRLGMYEYPTEWQGSFSIDGREAMFKVSTFAQQTTEYLLFAGARLAWAKGYLNFDGQSYPIYGIAEVEGRWQGKKEIQESEWRNSPADPETPGRSWEQVVR